MRLLPFRHALVAALTLVGAVLSAHSAALGYWRVQAPEAVPRPWAGDPAIRLDALQRTGRQAGADASQATWDGASLAAAARVSLRRDPLDPRALASLGGALLAADGSRGSNLIALADRVSRRDLPTQFMLIEVAVQRGEVPTVLAHYDRAMTVHPETATLLAPVLAGGLTEPEIRARLVPYARRLWFGPFLDAALANGAEPSALVALIGSASEVMPRGRLRESANQLAGRLANAGRFAELRALLSALPPELAGPSARFGLPEPGTSPGLAVLDWSLADDAQGQAALLPGPGLAIRVAPEQRSVAARRTTLLEPGRYELRYAVASADAAPLAGLEWSLTCGGGGNGPVSITPVASGPTGGQRHAVDLPQGCPAQHWRLHATGARAQVPSQAVLSGLSLRRIAS